MELETIFFEVSDRATARRVASWSIAYDVGLISPPNCAAMMGLPWWETIVAGLGMRTLLDCGASANLAATAMRAGLYGVVADTTPGQYRSLQALAVTCRSTLFSSRPASTRIEATDPQPYQFQLVSRALTTATLKK